nr:serine hydrolase [Polymorphobacter sp.]
MALHTYPDANASDPVHMGWMQGSPPPTDRIIRFADGGTTRFPEIRWAFSNLRQLMPTIAVLRAGPISALPMAVRDDLDAITFTPLPNSGFDTPMTWQQSLAANYTDGILVLHRGQIVQERYFGALTPDRVHIAMSVTKSYVGTLAAMLVADGSLDPGSLVAAHIPELTHSGFATATIRHLMDMRVGITFSEDYTDPNAAIWNYARAGSFWPRPPGYTGPTSFYESLRSIPQDRPHGGDFRYQTAITEVLGWVLRRVTGQPLETLISTRFWQPLGMEHDACLTVDETGTAMAGAGFNAALRDQARFGEMLRLGGTANRLGDTANGQQIISPAVIADIARGGDRSAFATAGYNRMPGASYRNMWWCLHNDHGAYAARGIHGQAIYIDPVAEMVIARFGSHPMAANANLDPTSLPAFHALAKHLMA